MIKHTLKKLPQNTFEFIIDISWDEIEKEYKLAFDVILADFSFEGFRKGKVPAALGEKHIPKDKVYNQLLKTLLPRIYEDIIKKEGLKPIVQPKIDIVKAKEKEEWQLKMVVAEKPSVELGDFKKNIQALKADKKKDDIWVPGKEKGEEPKEQVQAKQDKLLNETLALLLKEVKCDISPLLIEGEVEKRLTQLVDDVQKLGLTTEKYLQTKNLTIDKLKEQYSKEITDMYKLEFILIDIADKESIKVEQSDMDKLFGNIADAKERASAQSNAYFYASILRKQKTLDFLISL